jgi:carbamoyl-phosphate synthase large subunit
MRIPAHDAKKVVILGGGPNRIGQGIEFDYCCCHACYALTAAGYETIMVNCNPETVSTDYDTSDRLYFEPLTLEHVLEILRVEQENGTLHGVIVQFGGQTPLKLANALHEEGIPILGTTPDAIDLAEDRERFQQLLHELGLKQPHNGTARSRDEAFTVAKDVGYPWSSAPPSSWAAARWRSSATTPSLNATSPPPCRSRATARSCSTATSPVRVEVDVDALSDGKSVHVAGIMEHIEEAGVHSGDRPAACRRTTLSAETVEELKRQTVRWPAR